MASREERKKIRIETIDNNQTHLCLGFPGVAYPDKRRSTALCLSAYLGGGMSSVLFQKIREEKGLAYSVYAYNDIFRDSGVFGTYLGTDSSRLNQALKIVLTQCHQMRKTKLSSLSLDKVKSQLKGQITIALESTASRMTRLGRQELMEGRYTSLKQTLNEIDAITPRELQELANQFFDESKMAIAVLGPVELNALDHV
jgi:predicted Zn-dependent peptidase